MSAQQPITITYKCPKCGEEIRVEVTPDDLKRSLGGIITIPVAHGDPPHLLVLYIDENGAVRGHAVYEKLVRTFRVSLRDLITLVTPEKLANILFWVFAKGKINLKGEPSIVDSLKGFLKQVFGEDVVKPDGFEINVSSPQTPTVSVEPLLEIIRRAQKAEDPDIALAWIRSEIQRLKKVLEELEMLVRVESKLSARKLTKDLKISKDELIMLAEILSLKGLPVKEKIDLIELKIKDLLI